MKIFGKVTKIIKIPYEKIYRLLVIFLEINIFLITSQIVFIKIFSNKTAKKIKKAKKMFTPIWKKNSCLKVKEVKTRDIIIITRELNAIIRPK